jgi:predicted neutral ceramidase superfamily lipid hydrolase
MDILSAYLLATLSHFQAAFFLGLLPVMVIGALCISLTAVYSRTADVLMFAAAFSFTGAALGLMIGASREPVVQAALPAIVTVISGLLVFVFPKSEGASKLLGTEEDASPNQIRQFVLVAVTTLMLGSITGAFWGGSIRAIREEDDRRYAEWLIQFEQVRIPVELAIIAKDQDLEISPAEPTTEP